MPPLRKRSEHRIAVRLPMHVRGVDREGLRFDEKTESENVCRRGAAFVTVHQLDLGTQVEIFIPLPGQAPGSETDFATRGRVVHVGPGKTQTQKIVGVEFIGPRFHRVFVPETTG
jgi:hypothetical protein